MKNNILLLGQKRKKKYFCKKLFFLVGLGIANSANLVRPPGPPRPPPFSLSLFSIALSLSRLVFEHSRRSRVCVSQFLHDSYMSRAGFEPGVYDYLLLEFAVAQKPTQPPQPNTEKYYYNKFLTFFVNSTFLSSIYFIICLVSPVILKSKIIEFEICNASRPKREKKNE